MLPQSCTIEVVCEGKGLHCHELIVLYQCLIWKIMSILHKPVSTDGVTILADKLPQPGNTGHIDLKLGRTFWLNDLGIIDAQLVQWTSRLLQPQPSLEELMVQCIDFPFQKTKIQQM